TVHYPAVAMADTTTRQRRRQTVSDRLRAELAAGEASARRALEDARDKVVHAGDRYVRLAQESRHDAATRRAYFAMAAGGDEYDAEYRAADAAVWPWLREFHESWKLYVDQPTPPPCACGCNRHVPWDVLESNTGRVARFATVACRNRAMRRR